MPENIKKIVITGGPCGGKTSALEMIGEELPKLGYKVIFMYEVATELITGGISPWECSSNLEFQKCLMKLQVYKERVFMEAARSMTEEKIVIVCDRGALDNKAYMTQEEFIGVLESVNSSEERFMNSYNAVFHLVTTAKGAEEHYSTRNNQARKETPEMARAVDDKIIESWSSHPYFRIIDNRGDFKDKMEDLKNALLEFLSESDSHQKK